MIDQSHGVFKYNILKMEPQITAFLLDLNLRFYRQFGKAFAETRRRIQPGVRRALQMLPELMPKLAGFRVLDLGCGSGALAAAWVKNRMAGSYSGVDFSPELLEEADSLLAETLASLPYPFPIRFLQADLSQPAWTEALEGEKFFDGALAFAVLHHLPGVELRLRLMQQVRGLLNEGGIFFHSVWQFHLSPRLAARSLPWSSVGIDDDAVEEGDTLLDWRHALPKQAERVGLRYVHRFSREELESLANNSGFVIVDEYESDGKEGRLGLYQVWRAG